VVTFGRLLVELAFGVLAPNACASCDAPVRIRTIFCRPCAATLNVPETLDPRHLAAFDYGGALATAIWRFKFEGRADLARPLADVLRRTAQGLSGSRVDAVVPVPLHQRRLIERGYNQSALLARPVARDLGAAFYATGLTRTRDTERQVSLDRELRARNVVGAFRSTCPQRFRQANVLVIDDVRTTGATLRACAEVLYASGAIDVRTLVLAQA